LQISDLHSHNSDENDRGGKNSIDNSPKLVLSGAGKLFRFGEATACALRLYCHEACARGAACAERGRGTSLLPACPGQTGRWSESERKREGDL